MCVLFPLLSRALPNPIYIGIRVGVMVVDEGKVKLEKFNGAKSEFLKMQIEDYLYEKKLCQPLSEKKLESMKDENWSLLDKPTPQSYLIDVIPQCFFPHWKCKDNGGSLQCVCEAINL